MLTFFAVPKPSIGHIGLIQRNAVHSWARLGKDCQIVLCADEPGTRELADEVGGLFLPDIERNSFGTPLLSSVFTKVSQVAKHPTLCYLNADIIVSSRLLAAVSRIHFSDFLMVGRRTRVDIRESIDFANPRWETELKQIARSKRKPDVASAIDYMLFPRSSPQVHLPPFAVGRPYWDNWVVYRALTSNLPVIDATAAVTIFHQDHDYRHVPQPRGMAWDGPEADINRQFIGDISRQATIESATYLLDPWKLRRRWPLVIKTRLFIHWFWNRLRLPGFGIRRRILPLICCPRTQDTSL
jgi:hypothetical protein